MSTITPFDTRGNYTRIHNYALDYIMPLVKANDWKVLCFIIRQTAGWGKDAEQLSYGAIKKGTGIKSDATLSASIKRLLAEKYILSAAGNKRWIATKYSLNTALEIEVTSKSEAESPTSKNEVPTSKTVAAPTSKNEVSPTSKNEVYIKESIKEKEERGLPLPSPVGSNSNSTARNGSHRNSDSVGDARRQQRLTAERIVKAEAMGIPKTRFVQMVNWLLAQYGRTAVVDAGTAQGDKYLGEAQEAALSLASLGVDSDAAIIELLDGFPKDDWRTRSGLPSMGQLVDRASEVASGRGAATKPKAKQRPSYLNIPEL